MSESLQDQINRVRLMSHGNDKWDLSSNDIAALKAVLERMRRLEEALQPFAAMHGRMNREGGPDYSYMEERIRSWFGVGDFSAAHSAISMEQGRSSREGR